MRNTHFGGEGSGGLGGGFHQSKFKGTTAALVAAATTGAVFEQFNLDSDRNNNQISRKRGAKTTNTRNIPGGLSVGEGDNHQSIRDSYTKIPTLN